MGAQRKGTRVKGPYAKFNGTFRISVFREDGKRRDYIYQSARTALEAKERIEREIELTAGTSIRQALDRYRPHLCKDDQNTEESARDTVWKVGRLFAGHEDRPVASFKKDEGKDLYKALCAYISPRTKKPYAPDSHKNMLIEARTFMRWCVDEKLATVNIFAEVTGSGTRRPGSRKKTPTSDECRKWLDKAEELVKAGKEGAMAAVLTLYLDMRSKEIRTRQVRDVDVNGTVLIIDRDGTKTDTGQRSLEIPKDLQPMFRVLVRGKAPTDYLFGPGKKPRHKDWVSKWVLKICNLAKVPEARSHAMRRAHATIATARGITGHEVARSMGHRSFKTTLHSYVQRGTAEKVQREKTLSILLDLREERHGPKRQAQESAEDQAKNEG